MEIFPEEISHSLRRVIIAANAGCVALLHDHF
jgi:hypothetical protein